VTVDQQVKQEERDGTIRQLIETDPNSEVYMTYRRRHGVFVKFMIIKLNGEKHLYHADIPDPEKLRTIRLLQLGA
jgi:hypothetical protein